MAPDDDDGPAMDEVAERTGADGAPADDRPGDESEDRDTAEGDRDDDLPPGAQAAGEPPVSGHRGGSA
ncbi:hypothetical protein [Dermatobacter hominis]|uniref:hypothetical protein n=1 Tax=Dermatobacter hominis TaxID=2884263 RepID=UPI001D11FCC3|nr:hypothetical protein [Dermatobacter hominis]UDY37516.1 hypothetical protein LH044_08240 [Dermatobacter hominis]